MNRTVLPVMGITMLVMLGGCSDKAEDSAAGDSDAEVTEMSADTPPRDDDDVDASGKGPLDVRQGMVEYRLEGMQTGTITKYWRNYGAETAEYHDTSMNMMGFVQADKKWIIVTPDTVYTIDQAAGTATKAVNPGKAMMGDMNRDQMQAFGKEMLQQMGQRDGEMDVAGETCEKWTMTQMGSEVCLWKGIDLYTASNMAGMSMSRTAVQLDTGKVDGKHFVVPDNIQVTDVGNPMDWQQQMEKMIPPDMMPRPN